MNVAGTKKILNNYVEYLNELGLSKISIKNYKSDINLFLNSTQISDSSIISRELIDQYLKFLEKTISINILKRKKTAFVHLKNYLGINKENFYDFRQMFNFKAPYVILFGLLAFYVIFQASRDMNSQNMPYSDIAISSVPITQTQGQIIMRGNQKIVLLNQDESPAFTQPLAGEMLKSYTYSDPKNINDEIHGFANMKIGQKNVVMYDNEISADATVFLTLNTKSESQIYVSRVFDGGFEVNRERALDTISLSWLSVK